MDRIMRRMRKVDAAVLMLSLSFLTFNLATVGPAGRERAKRVVCLANLKQLMVAWTAYADQNDGKIVNGAGGFHYLQSGQTEDGSAAGIIERAWVGRGWGYNWNSMNVANTGVTDAQKAEAIHEGALWPLVGDERCYKCPVGRRYEWITYAIVDAMNGLHRTGTTSVAGHHPYAVGKRIGDTVLWVKNRNEIISPPAAERMVFIDEGALTPDSFGVNYVQGPWWDNPPGRHNDGTTVSWADGHASYLQWKAAETIEYARRYKDYYGGGNFMPRTPEGIKELDDFRRAVWGRLGYEPSK
jgi:prepilin-type processing-associated H-X9-DG protein